jgi:hypothetical protein
MKKYLKSVLLAALLACFLPSMARAVAAPVGLSVTPWTNQGVTLSWTDNPAALQWYIYVNGLQLFSPDRYNISGPTGGVDSFVITGISQQALPVFITMKAVGQGAVSAFSAAVTVTAVSPVPFTYVVPAPGSVWATSGSSGSSGTASTVNQGTSPWVVGGTVASTQSGTWNLNNISGAISLPTGAATSANQTTANSSLTSILAAFSNVTVNTHAVTQNGTWTVAQGAAGASAWPVTVPAGVTVNNLNSVTITGTISENQTQINGVTIATGNGVAGTDVQRMTIASDNTPFRVGISHTVSVNGALTTAGNVSLNAGTNTTMIGGVNVSQINAVTPLMGNGTTGSGSLRVTLASDNAANLNPWLVSGSSASASSDSGNPVKIGGVVNTTLPTFTSGQRANAQMDVNGKLYVALSNTAATPVYIAGPVSATVTVAGNPMLSGCRASVALPTAVSNGAAVFAMADKTGRSIVALNGPRERKSKATITLSTTAETTLCAAGSAGVFHDLELLYASNGSTQTVRVDIRDATAGPVIFSSWLSPGGGGFIIAPGTTIPQTTAANDWTAQLSTGIATNDVRLFNVCVDAN